MKSIILLASLLLFSGSCVAAINPGSDIGTGGELIFSVWDDTTQTSYTLDLGIDSRSFNPNQDHSFILSSDQNWNTFISGVSTDDIRWNIVASDRDSHPSLSGNGLSSNGLTFTGRTNDSTVLDLGANFLNTLQYNTENYIYHLDGTDTVFAENNSYLHSGTNYAGSPEIQTLIANLAFPTYGDYGESLAFWHVGTTTHPEYPWIQEAVHMKDSGTWTLSGNTLVYSSGHLGFQMLAPVVVPVPAAIWLLASSLVGLGSVARRRR